MAKKKPDDEPNVAEATPAVRRWHVTLNDSQATVEATDEAHAIAVFNAQCGIWYSSIPHSVVEVTE